jgi:hypothetical protein
MKVSPFARVRVDKKLLGYLLAASNAEPCPFNTASSQSRIGATIETPNDL